MPRITAERREARREQVLEAARACLQDHGLEAVSVEMIIDRSGLSTGAVYGYFTGKDQIIGAVISEGTTALARDLAPVLSDPTPPPPPELLGRVLQVLVEFGRHEKGDVDRLLVALHGWSHSQSDPELRAKARESYAGHLRGHFAEVARRWQGQGAISADADPEMLAQLLMSITLGFVVQRAMAGTADVDAHVRALNALMEPRTA